MASVSETSPALQDCLAGLKVDILGVAGSEKWSGTEFEKGAETTAIG